MATIKFPTRTNVNAVTNCNNNGLECFFFLFLLTHSGFNWMWQNVDNWWDFCDKKNLCLLLFRGTLFIYGGLWVGDCWEKRGVTLEEYVPLNIVGTCRNDIENILIHSNVNSSLKYIGPYSGNSQKCTFHTTDYVNNSLRIG